MNFYGVVSLLVAFVVALVLGGTLQACTPNYAWKHPTVGEYR